jgi:hypothetical protein
MSKPHFCKNIIEIDGEKRPCGKINPLDFDTGRKSTCKECRKIKNNNYNKERYHEDKDDKEKVKEEFEKTLKKEMEEKASEMVNEAYELAKRKFNRKFADFLNFDSNLVNIIQDVVEFHVFCENETTIPNSIKNLQEYIDDYIEGNKYNREKTDEKIKELKEENKFLKEKIDFLFKHLKL